jgi:S1-C subfamily serine protease
MNACRRAPVGPVRAGRCGSAVVLREREGSPCAGWCNRSALAVLLVLLAAHAWASPQGRAGAIETASRATVFLRVIGDLDLVPSDDLAIGERFHRSNVELATGSGFLISPLGQVLTCHHVVADGERTGQIGGRKAKVATKVTRIEVFVPSSAEGMPTERYEAAVVSSNPDLDLAVLTISGASFPVAELGDSDALEPGDGLDVLGFPFGRDVEIGRPASAPPVAPDVSVSHGDFSAFRQDEQGTRRFLQTTASVNPGNSGGPILDSEGFVVGIVSRRLSSTGAAIGFAVPINLVKEYLESSALDAQLPVRRLSLGGPQTIEGKGLRLRLPWGLVDASPFRVRVESAPAGALPALRIDRLLSSWDVVRLSEALASGQAFEAFSPAGPARQKVRTNAGRRVVAGRISGTTPDGVPVRVEYAVIDLGQEKLVARYTGAPEVLAYNGSVFRASLASLEGELLRRPSAPGTQVGAWAPIASAPVGSPLRRATLPGGWLQEPQGPLPCRGLVQATDAVSASPLPDFSRTLRVGVVRQPGMTAAGAAGACGTPGAEAGDYQGLASWLGATIYVEGRFVQVADGEFVQFEVVGSAEDRAALHELFSAWTAHVRTTDR